MEVCRLEKLYQQVVATALSVRGARHDNVLQWRGESIEKARYKGVITNESCVLHQRLHKLKEIFQAPGGQVETDPELVVMSEAKWKLAFNSGRGGVKKGN